MPPLCLYFHAHQPMLLRGFTLLDINKGNRYEDEAANLENFNAFVDFRCLPLNRLLYRAVQESGGALRLGISLSGTFLEMLEKHRPDAVAGYKSLAQTGMVELLGENYFRSYAFLFSEEEFVKQVKLHRKKLKELFGSAPATYRNTESCYNNRMASCIGELGFRTLLNDARIEAAEIARVYRPAGAEGLCFIQGGSRLSDFNFELSKDQGRTILPLSIDCGFLDESGLSDVFGFIEKSLKEGRRFILPGEAGCGDAPLLDIPVRRGRPWTPAAQGKGRVNYMQSDALQALYSLSGRVRRRGNTGLLAAWRRLQSTDHFQNMQTAPAGRDNPYGSPYEAYLIFMNILADISKSTAGGRKY